MKQLKSALKYLLAFVPERLPVGATAMEKFMSDIIELSGEYADKDSMRFAIASMIIHAPSQKGALSKHYFVVRLRKSAANQVASQVFQEIKAAEDAMKKKQAEATANTQQVASNGTQQN